MPAGETTMRLVLDTNIIVSGLLWRGPPRAILDHARSGRVTLFTTPALLAELDDVLTRPKFDVRLVSAGVVPAELVHGFAALCAIVRAASIPPVIVQDPDDDEVLA